MPYSVENYLSETSGAVTVDWVVMTAAAVGLGLATMGVVSGGVENLTGDINTQLTSDSWRMFRNGMQSLAFFDFTGGDAEGWSGGSVMDMGGELGELLVLGPGQATGFLVDVPDGTELAVMEFELVAGDSLDSSDRWGYDTATVMLNGVPVAIAEASHDAMTFEIPQLDGTTVEATVLVQELELGGQSRWNDSVAGVTILVDQPTEPIQFELHSGANQGVNDEYWGIDGFEASTSGAPGF